MVKTETNKEENTNTVIGLIIAGVFTWAFPKYFLLGVLNITISWWVYVIIFFIVLGAMSMGLNTNSAVKNIAKK